MPANVDPQDKEKVIAILNQVKKAIEEDELKVCVIMLNGQTTWIGDPFTILGWIRYYTEIMLATIFARPKSQIVSPHDLKTH